MSGTIFKPPVYTCMVEGCENESDPGSTQCLCRLCYTVITTGKTDKYYEDHKGKTWISDTVMKIFHTREDNKELEEHNEYLEGIIKELKQEVKDLEEDRDNAYFLADGRTLSVNDLRTFYHENKVLKSALNSQNLPPIHENQALKEGHKRKDEFIDSLRKEIEALNYNIDHAHKDGDKFLTVDDLCIFYQENKKIHDVVQQQHNRIVLLGLQLKKANETVKFQAENIQSLNNQLNSMEKEFTEKEKERSKEETFATKAQEYFDERAKIIQERENMKFDMYTEGFRRGFDMGYEKAKDQYYE